MSISQRVKLAIARRKLSSHRIAFGSENALEVWEQNKIRAEFKRSPQLREAIGRDELGTIERSDMREYQLHKFRQQMDYVMKNSYYYKKSSEAAGTGLGHPTWEDLQKVLTEPADPAKNLSRSLRLPEQGRRLPPPGPRAWKRLFYTQNDVLNTSIDRRLAKRSA